MMNCFAVIFYKALLEAISRCDLLIVLILAPFLIYVVCDAGNGGDKRGCAAGRSSSRPARFARRGA